MRTAHRPRTLPNKKLPRGIERQDELLDLIERRFHQEDLIRDALRKTGEADTAEASTPADDTEHSSAEASTLAGDTEHISDEESTPAGDTEHSSAEENTPADDAEHISAEENAPAVSVALSAEESTPAVSIALPKEEHAPADTPDAVTIRWHGQHETIAAPLVWLTVFDTVREAGDAITREIADRRFHGESYWKTCDALYLSTGTYYHHVRAILHYAFACAVYHRLIDPRPKHRRPKAK